ncbi:mRNA methyltransferase [Cryptococcus deuterogattii CA1014]|nr:mRNA methyltransferase [Cryptococcus deuterogattii CA1014]
MVPTVWLALRRASNSACSAGGRGGGPGRLKEGGARKKEGVVWTDFESIRRAKRGRSEMCESMMLNVCYLGKEDVVAKSCKEWKLSFGGSVYGGQARVEVVQRRAAYLNLCYGDPMFTKNPSLGDGPGPRGGTKDCRYQHFQVTPSTIRYSQPLPEGYPSVMPGYLKKRILGYDDVQGQSKEVNVAQWINCDLRRFDYSLLGQFQVIVADPAWDIHMTLPYGTITDDEMRNMPIRSLQPDWGIFCLWVTGRAMELGRVVFAHWGYKRVDELVWVKTNQLQRLIRTGRTGHWLNHTCEHLLVGLKIPQDFPREAPIPWDTEPALRDLRKCVDTDVVVAEVRETSRKPEEVYGVIERLVPKGRKLELFGRKHNIRPGWVTLGNQLGDSQITEPDLYDRLVKTYPKQKFTFVPPKQSSL